METVSHILKDLESKWTSQTQAYDDVMRSQAHLSRELQTMQHKVKEYEASAAKDQLMIHKLEMEVAQLKDDNAAFSKVSQIIAMEKENARLRNELSALQKKLTTTTVEEEKEKEEEETFCPKKIKGKIYYISQKTNDIYECTDEEEVGARLGTLINKNNRWIPEWLAG
jgi:predicted  nucleic acid-binding Zn-ribbon protein